MKRCRSASQRDIAVLLFWHGIDLGFEHAERADQASAGFMRFDHIVYKPVFGGDEGAGEAVLEFRYFLLAQFAIFARKLPAVNDIDSSFSAHDGDLGGGPGQVDI